MRRVAHECPSCTALVLPRDLVGRGTGVWTESRRTAEQGSIGWIGHRQSAAWPARSARIRRARRQGQRIRERDVATQPVGDGLSLPERGGSRGGQGEEALHFAAGRLRAALHLRK